jgi:hypothetical protein
VTSAADGQTLAAIAVAAFGDDAHRLIARIGGGRAVGAAAAVAALARLSAIDARQTRAAWAAGARAPVPAGVRGIEASWIEHALGDEPAAARAAVAHGGDGGPLAVWLARRVCARFPILPAARDRWPQSPGDAIACAGGVLAAWLAAIGADQVAVALAAAGAAPVDRAATARISVAPRAGALGPVRAALARCAGIQLADAMALPRIGARALAPHLPDPAEHAMLAHRLPRPLGLAISAELAAHAVDPVDRAPTWAALGAAI